MRSHVVNRYVAMLAERGQFVNAAAAGQMRSALMDALEQQLAAHSGLGVERAALRIVNLGRAPLHVDAADLLARLDNDALEEPSLPEPTSTPAPPSPVVVASPAPSRMRPEVPSNPPAVAPSEPAPEAPVPPVAPSPPAAPTCAPAQPPAAAPLTCPTCHGATANPPATADEPVPITPAPMVAGADRAPLPPPAPQRVNGEATGGHTVLAPAGQAPEAAITQVPKRLTFWSVWARLLSALLPVRQARRTPA